MSKRHKLALQTCFQPAPRRLGSHCHRRRILNPHKGINHDPPIGRHAAPTRPYARSVRKTGLAHLPSGRFGANSAWILCAAITHNLLRAAATLAGPRHAATRGATLRRKIVNIPARLARPQRRPVLHLPSHWPWADAWLQLCAIPSDTPHHAPRHPDHPAERPNPIKQERLGRPAETLRPQTNNQDHR